MWDRIITVIARLLLGADKNHRVLGIAAKEHAKRNNEKPLTVEEAEAISRRST